MTQVFFFVELIILFLCVDKKIICDPFLWRRNFLEKSSVFPSLDPYFAQLFFLENDSKKKQGEAKNKATMKIDPPPTANNYERRTRHISRRKFDVTNNLNGNLNERIMEEAGKQRCNMVPQSLNSNGEGC